LGDPAISEIDEVNKTSDTPSFPSPGHPEFGLKKSAVLEAVIRRN
jgi:hypothetical protein